MIRIMIADNNRDLCVTLTDFLNTQPDMQVVTCAYDGEQALAHIGTYQPDVVLLDITMPKLDGMAVLERLGQLDLDKQPYVMILTAMENAEIIQRFMELGASYYMIKPWDNMVLAERIRQFASANVASVLHEARESFVRSPAHTDESIVTQLLHEIGVPPHFKGYGYLRDAVLLVVRDPSLINGALTRQLYPKLAQKYGTTAAGVEAAIRNCMVACWQGGNREYLSGLTGVAGTRRKTFPTNSVVIARLADAVHAAYQAG